MDLKNINIVGKVKTLNPIRKLGKIVGKIVLVLLLLFIVLLLVFSIPAVQTSVAKRITDSINEKNNVHISIDKIGLTYLGNIDLDEVLIKDHHLDTLIYAKEVQTSIFSFSNILNNNPELGNTQIEQLELHMKIYEGEKKDNLALFMNSFRSKKKKKRSVFELTASEINLLNSHYSFINENVVNQEVIIVDDLDILAENLEIKGNNVWVDVRKFSGFEKRGLEITDLSTEFSLTDTVLQLEKLRLSTPNSSLVANIHIDVSNGYSDFENQVPIKAKIEEASISSSDLQYFYSGFGKGQKINFSTGLEGTLNDFILNNFKLRGMNRTVLNGDYSIQNLFNTKEGIFKIQGDLSPLVTNYYDLVRLLPGVLRGKLPEELKRLGNVRVQGDALLTENSLNTDVLLFTELGSADVDMVLGNFNDSEFATYKGVLKVNEFNLGRLLKNKSLGKTSFDLNIDGGGFTQESLNTEVRGAISEFGFHGYVYHNIKIRGILKAPRFNGNLVSFDPNLKMEFNGLADLSEEINIYDFNATVSYADLSALNFIKRDSISILKGDIFMNMVGTNLNNAEGQISLLNTSYKNHNDTYFFDDLTIISSFDGPVRTIAVHSPDVINGSLEGIFDITEVDALFENAVGSLYTNYRPNKLTTNQYLEFDFNIYNKIVELFFPQITLAPNTFIKGRVESDDSEFRLSFQSPKITTFDNILKQVNVQVDNTNPLFNTYIQIDSVATDYYNLSEFDLINVTLNDTLFFRTEFRGGEENNDVFNLNMYHTINEKNNSVVGIQTSKIKFKENEWFLNELSNNSNRVIFENGFTNIMIDSLVLSHQNEEIKLSGQMRDSTYKEFRLKFDHVDLGKITPEWKKIKMGGIVNGDLNILQQHGAYLPNSELSITNFKINEKLVGDLNLNVTGNEDLSRYAINTSLDKKGVETLSAVGTIVVDQDVPIIDVYLGLNELSLSPFGFIGGSAIGNIRGLLSGNARVTGNYKNPDFSGGLMLREGGLSIPYLNVDYALEDEVSVHLREQSFIFNNITFTDTKSSTTGLLNGAISHQNFSKWTLDLDIDSDRLLVLNTEADENALYYGTAFINGNASIYGPTNELVIDVTASTEEGTIFNIPITESISIGDNSFIHFLSPEEKAARLAGKEIIFEEAKGLELNFDLDVTSDALVEIDIDGSVLRGRGVGTLLMEINTLGKFKMWGDYIVNEGEYVFNYSAFQKKFEVQPGGNINWNGDPIGANINVSAVYEAHANPAIILENPSISRRIPVDVIINLEGELIQPEFSFDLEFPNVTSAVRSELEYKIETNINTEMQAFSLLTLNQFYTPNVFARSSGSAVVGNLFEGASGFFNNLLSDESGVFQVGLNYEQGARTPEVNTADRFGVTLSTQISDRVLINGKVGVPIGGVTETVVVGNLEIEFLLNKEGNLRATIFNRENNIQYIGEELGFTQGIGLSYRVDFDTFRELINKILTREIKTSKKEREQEESSKSLIPDYIRFPGEGEYL